MKNSNQQVLPAVTYHIGLAKTGSTFLQGRVFPKFKGVKYLTGKDRHRPQSVLDKEPETRILVSREFDRQFDREIDKLIASFPDVQIIVFLRRHDLYMASQYRRFVKNGYRFSFQEFIDVEKDTGFFKKEHLNYMRQLKKLEANFNRKPLVYLFEDLKKQPEALVQHLAKSIGAEVHVNEIDFTPKHTSYSEKQLKRIQALSGKINLKKRRFFKNSFLNLFGRAYLSSIRYPALYLFKALPEKNPNQPLIGTRHLEELKTYFAEDWASAKAYARQYNSFYSDADKEQ